MPRWRSLVALVAIGVLVTSASTAEGATRGPGPKPLTLGHVNRFTTSTTGALTVRLATRVPSRSFESHITATDG